MPRQIVNGFVILKTFSKKEKNRRRVKVSFVCKNCGKVSETTIEHLKKSEKQGCKYCWSDLFVKKDAPINSLYAHIKNRANIRNLDFNLSIKDFKKLIKSNCFYCGQKPNNIYKVPRHKFFYSGIDRVDSSVGYIKNNCVSSCKRCNLAKNNMSQLEFMEWIERVYRYNKCL